MAMRNVSRAPKRRIEKVYSNVATTISNSANYNVLHTCEDAKTLVRMRITGNVVPISGQPLTNIGIQIKPNGTRVRTPSSAESLDNPEPKTDLWQTQIYGDQATGGTFQIDVDSKAMRKLQELDVIEMWDISNVASSSLFTCTVTMWFKE